MPESEKIEELTEGLKKYVNTNFQLIKLKATEQTSLIGASFISAFIVGTICLFFIFFTSLSVGFYLSNYWGSTYSGFAIVAAFYFLLGFVLIIIRKKMLEKPLRDKIIQKIISEN